jgi:hypothetical protein
MTIVDIKLNLSDEVLEYLQRESEKRKVSLDDVVSEVLSDYFDEPTDDEILENMREALRDGLAGKVRPVDDVLAELKQELGFHADEG